jgi:hypothetical protein
VGAAPRVAEAVETVLEELERGEDAPGREALDDLLVEQRVDVAVGLGGILGIDQLGEAERTSPRARA